MQKWVSRGLFWLVVALVLAQAIRPSRVNPAIAGEHEIQSHLAVDPAVDAIFSRSCNDCHSHKTVWPWYTNVAPVSWLVAWDVKRGRRELNFSEWGTYSAKRVAKKLDETCEEVTHGDMPPKIYTLPHSNANLSPADVEAVCRWTQSVGGTKPESERGE